MCPRCSDWDSVAARGAMRLACLWACTWRLCGRRGRCGSFLCLQSPLSCLLCAGYLCCICSMDEHHVHGVCVGYLCCICSVGGENPDHLFICSLTLAWPAHRCYIVHVPWTANSRERAVAVAATTKTAATTMTITTMTLVPWCVFGVPVMCMAEVNADHFSTRSLTPVQLAHRWQQAARRGLVGPPPSTHPPVAARHTSPPPSASVYLPRADKRGGREALCSLRLPTPLVTATPAAPVLHDLPCPAPFTFTLAARRAWYDG